MTMNIEGETRDRAGQETIQIQDIRTSWISSDGNALKKARDH